MLFRLLPALLLALTVPALHAESEAPRKELTEQTSTGLGKLRPLIDAKDYPSALTLIDSLLPATGPASFDRYVLSQIKAQILLTKGKLIDAIAPLEAALALSEANPVFFDAATHREQLNLLAQLHYQRATELKGDAQLAGYDTALGYARRLLARNPQPTAEQRVFVASLLYQAATSKGDQVNQPRIREALDQAGEALLLSARPSDQVYQILIACHLQLGENARAAELLELLAARDPQNVATWSQLQSIYLAAAADTRDPDEARAWSLRALHTLDRAQAKGLLDTPRDNYTRVAVLFNIQQYDRAAELLETGLAATTIESSRRNWELLASAHQQTGREDRALDALTRAVTRFPADAGLEFSLAQTLYNAGRVPEAYDRGRAAIAKGSLEQPGQARVYLAYLAYELRRLDEAAAWIAEARAAGGVPAATLDPLTRAIDEARRAPSNT